jgi:hypothetical protein
MVIWYGTLFEKALPEDEDHVDGVACPVEAYTSTDEVEGPYSVTQTVESQVITEMLEIHYQSIKAFGSRGNSDTLPN